MTDTDPNTTPAAIDAIEAAYNASLPDIQAVPTSELINITLDAVAITTSMLGVLPELRALRDQISATWRDFNLDRFDKLEQYGLALVHAHAMYNRLSTPRTNVTEKAAELTRVRDRLYAVAVPLVEYGLVNNSEIEKCKVAVGYKPLVSDVTILVGMFKDHWSALEGKVPLTLEELVRAKNLALEFMQQLGLKEQSPVAVGDAALIRQKAFTLFVRTYEEARRAVVYLRADAGDANDIAPSFYALRTGKRRPAEEAPAPPAATPASAPVPLSAPPPPLPVQNHAGLPIDNPFTN